MLFNKTRQCNIQVFNFVCFSKKKKKKIIFNVLSSASITNFIFLSTISSGVGGVDAKSSFVRYWARISVEFLKAHCVDARSLYTHIP